MKRSLFFCIAILLLFAGAVPCEESSWISLFDGETLNGWERQELGGSGEVKIEENAIVIGMGVMGSGVRYQAPEDAAPFPKTNYEIEYTAKRSMGYDFFAALTFPVGEEGFCTLVNGGWGGTLVGLSSIDGYDASENNASSYYGFKRKTWYTFRLRVNENEITAWINDKEIVHTLTIGHRFTTRVEMDRFHPLGFATWISEGRIKDIRYRLLTEEEINASNEKTLNEVRKPLHIQVN